MTREKLVELAAAAICRARGNGEDVGHYDVELAEAALEAIENDLRAGLATMARGARVDAVYVDEASAPCAICGGADAPHHSACGEGAAELTRGAREAADVERYRLAREAADRAAQYADAGCIENLWEVGGGLWDDEATDHLYENREELDAEAYALARELLAERRRDRCRK